MQTVWRTLFGLLRIWLGFQWLEAGLHKMVSPTWVGSQAGVAIRRFFEGAIAKAAGDHPMVQPWYAWFLKHVAQPNAVFFSYLIPVGETLVGLALILGVATTVAAVAGAFMNLNFMLAGTTSTNPILFTAAVVLLFAGSKSWYYGVDRYLVPAVRRWLQAVRGPARRVAEQG